jgi:hypothetical protein
MAELRVCIHLDRGQLHYAIEPPSYGILCLRTELVKISSHTANNNRKVTIV